MTQTMTRTTTRTGRPIVTVFGSSTTPPDSPEWRDALRLGRLLAEGGYTVATGGYSGSMEAVSRGAREQGDREVRVLGVTAPSVFPRRDVANAYVTEEIAAEHLLARIHQLTDLAVAAIALPGSIGTLTELMVAWNLAHLAPLSEQAAKPLIAVGDRWERVIGMLAAEMQISSALIHTVPDANAAVSLLAALRSSDT